jgi:hypothetical protein
MLGHPTNRDFLGMVRGGMISNCPMTPTAVQKAHRIFGPDLAGIRGQTVRRPPDSVITDYVQILRVIDVSQFSVRYEFVLLACPAKARR